MTKGTQSPGQPEPSGPSAKQSELQPAQSTMGLTNLAPGSEQTTFDRILQWIPRLLSSKPHVVLLTLLGVYLVLLPLFGVGVSAKSELIGGNYTNVTSDIGACIAAGATLHLISQGRRRQRIDEERLRLLREVHSLLHHVHSAAAAELGHPEPSPASRDTS
jgi:hypothetical protein